MSDFKVEQIDHVHVYVSDQYEAAKWYEKVLGLVILKEYESWASDGPLTISSNDGGTSLALFNRPNILEKESKHHRVIAFRVNGPGFINFIDRLPLLELNDRQGHRVSSQDVVDHEMSYSIYFVDPYDNPYELTTYDYDFVKSNLHH